MVANELGHAHLDSQRIKRSTISSSITFNTPQSSWVYLLNTSESGGFCLFHFIAAEAYNVPSLKNLQKIVKPLNMYIFLAVPSASMTRLMRSRTASGSSVASLEGSRSRSHTGDGSRSRSHTGEGVRSRSHTGEGSRNRAHTDTHIELTPNSANNTEQPSPKSMEVSC